MVALLIMCRNTSIGTPSMKNILEETLKLGNPSNWGTCFIELTSRMQRNFSYLQEL